MSSKSISCFICEISGTLKDLRRASTFKLDTKVRKCALQLKDSKLLAKLSDGDLIAQKAKYHPACLTDLYRKTQAQTMAKETIQEENMNHSLVFAEMIEYIEEYRKAGEPFLKLADLVSLYTCRLENLEMQTEGRVHSSRLKNRLLAHFHDLRAYQEGRDIFLAFNEQVTGALKDAGMESLDAEAIYLAKAAKIICQDMFKTTTAFCNSFDEDCQVKSVPQSLLALISMILNGANIKSRKSASR